MNANERVAGSNASNGTRQNQQARRVGTGQALPTVDLEAHEILSAARLPQRSLPHVEINAVPIGNSGSTLQSRTLPIPALSQHQLPQASGPSSSSMPVAPQSPQELPRGADASTQRDQPRVNLFGSPLPDALQQQRREFRRRLI